MPKSKSKSKSKKITPWTAAVFRVFDDIGLSQVAYVPDAGLTDLIERCRSRSAMRCVSLTTEQEGVAMLAGAWLGGARGALLMQSSGVGNCINMLGMIQECRFPLLALVTMRGEWGEFNPWQVPMGQSTADALKTAGVIVQVADDEAKVADTVRSAARLAFFAYRAAAVLVSQRVVGVKDFK